jgi:hypothetical protein
MSLLATVDVFAAASVPSLNQCPDMIFIDGNENASQPSEGIGGSFPGTFSRDFVVGQNLETYYYYIPSSYQPNTPMPMLAVWHGAVFSGGGPAAAQNMIDFWQTEAEANRFIVVAQAAIGSSGCEVCGWLPGPDSQKLAFILDDMESRYNVEQTRRYVWGFSAGGFVMHALALNNADYFAAYAISGADLGYANSRGYTPANALRQIPAFISVGQSDSYYVSAQNDLVDFINAGWQMEHNLWFDGFVGGHELLNDLPQKAWSKICISTVLD